MANRVFISYSHADAEIVNKLAGIIEKASKLPVWIDDRLKGGENYFSAIANQIMECSYFVFFVSETSVASDWCLRELELAASEQKTIVAVWLANIPIPPRVKIIIHNTHYVYYYSATDDSFYDAISRTFSAGESSLREESKDDPELGADWNDTFFLEDEKVKKIEKLLSDEKQGRYSVCFQAENACLLGLAYELGIRVPIDIRKAAFYYKVSSHNGSYDGQYLYSALRRKTDTEADPASFLPDMIDAAEHRSVYALTYLGDDFYYGRNGCERDMAKAYKLWEMASASGGVVAMYYMAYGYRKGENVKRDLDISYMYALMATEYGFPRAFRLLGFMYEAGEIGEADSEKALEMYEEAIKRGDYQSLCYQGWIYGLHGDSNRKRELYERAVELAEEGKIKSALPYDTMGSLYEYGDGVPKDMARAADFYLKAAARGSRKARQYTVAAVMQIEDDKQRETYLKRAFELGCDRAAYELGNMEAARCSGERLPESAVRYYTKGAEAGDFQCVFSLLADYSTVCGHGIDRNDRLTSVRWFRTLFAKADEDLLKSLRSGDWLATYYYAFAIELDYDPEYNQPAREEARIYFRKSLEETPMHLFRIALFSTNAYLFPERSGMTMDVAGAEDMIRMIESYLEGYHAYLREKEPSNALQQWNDLAKILEEAYVKIAECYDIGMGIRKNKVTAREYQEKARQIQIRMDQISAAG